MVDSWQSCGSEVFKGGKFLCEHFLYLTFLKLHRKIYKSRKVGKNVNSPIVIANAWHHRSDAFSSIGALIGIAGAIFLGDKWTILDPIVSCGISIFIIVIAVKMALPCLEEVAK